MALDLDDQYNKIYTFCYFKVKNREVAEDLTQETFLKYFSSTNYLERGKPLAYLYTIARNNCNDYFRKGSMEETSEGNITDDFSCGLENTLTIQREIAKLDEQSKEILLLRFTNDLGINEIASYLGISRFVVYRKLNTILKQLKSNLRKEDFYE